MRLLMTYLLWSNPLSKLKRKTDKWKKILNENGCLKRIFKRKSIFLTLKMNNYKGMLKVSAMKWKISGIGY